MGYYINSAGGVPLQATGKALALINRENAKRLTEVPSQLPTDGNGIICVVNNGFFEAAAFAYSNEELAYFRDSSDTRPKVSLTMPLQRCKELSGY